MSELKLRPPKKRERCSGARTDRRSAKLKLRPPKHQDRRRGAEVKGAMPELQGRNVALKVRLERLTRKRGRCSGARTEEAATLEKRRQAR
jgi:hypothetical protein